MYPVLRTLGVHCEARANDTPCLRMQGIGLTSAHPEHVQSSNKSCLAHLPPQDYLLPLWKFGMLQRANTIIFIIKLFIIKTTMWFNNDHYFQDVRRINQLTSRIVILNTYFSDKHFLLF